MLTDIQYFAAHYVAFKNNLTEQDKSYLINWIKESSDDKIKSLLIRGDYEYHQEDVEIFNEAFDFLSEYDSWKRGYDIGHKFGVADTMAVGVAVAAAVTLGYKVYKRFLSKAAKSCSGFSGDQKTNCMAKYKKQAMQQHITSMTKSLSSCSKTKDPGKCKSKIGTKIKRVKAKLGTL
jgi:hypothetical protein